MATVIDGVYRLSLQGSEAYLTALGNTRVSLVPDKVDGQLWEIRQIEPGHHVVRLANGGQYLDFEGDPSPFTMLGLSGRPRVWEVGRGPEDTVVIGVPDAALTLGLSRLLISPPLVGLSEASPMDRSWVLEPA